MKETFKDHLVEQISVLGALQFELISSHKYALYVRYVSYARHSLSDASVKNICPEKKKEDYSSKYLKNINCRIHNKHFHVTIYSQTKTISCPCQPDMFCDPSQMKS